MNHRGLRQEVARVAKQLIESGLVTGTSGNVSARTPEGDVLVTPSGIDYEELEPGDVVLVDANGEIADRLHVNRNTVMAAYRQLTQAGVVETMGRGGTRVTDRAAVAQFDERRDQQAERRTEDDHHRGERQIYRPFGRLKI